MKRCARCRVEKEKNEFVKSKNRKDGLHPYCKLCKSLESKKYNKQNREKCRIKLQKWREENPEKTKEHSKTYSEKNRLKIVARRRTPEAKAKMLAAIKRWRLANDGRYRENLKGYVERNKDKIAVRMKLMNEVRQGRMIRPKKCEECSVRCKPQAHHEDYNKPLDVIWLCQLCHSKMHRKVII